MTIKTQYKPSIERGITKLMVPHENEERVFVYPSIGLNTYPNVGAEIINQGYRIPTGEEIVSLLHAAYCSELKDEPEFGNIRKIMRDNWLWVFLQELNTDYGFFSINDLSAQGRSVNASELEKKLSKEMKTWRKIKGTGITVNEDNSIRFVEEGSYVRGEIDSQKLAIDNGVIADYGKEGAEKLAEIASQFPNKPYIYRLKIKKGQSPELRVSALGDGSGGRLLVDGDGFGGDGGNHSFGVLN